MDAWAVIKDTEKVSKWRRSKGEANADALRMGVCDFGKPSENQPYFVLWVPGYSVMSKNQFQVLRRNLKPDEPVREPKPAPSTRQPRQLRESFYHWDKPTKLLPGKEWPKDMRFD